MYVCGCEKYAFLDSAYTVLDPQGHDLQTSLNKICKKLMGPIDLWFALSHWCKV